MTASINGIQLGPDSGAAWSLQAGTSPYQVDITMDTTTADAIVAAKGPFESTMMIGELSFSRLTATGTSPTNSPHEASLTVADARWAWPRAWVKRSYNLRRRTGLTRIAGDNVANVQQDEDYMPWSMDYGEPWLTIDILKDVLQSVHGAEDGKVVFDSGTIDLPIIEGLEIDSPGDVAIGRVLAEIGGGISVYLDREGVCHVYDLTDGTEAKLLGVTTGTRERGAKNSDLPRVVGFPVFAMSDRSVERPMYIRVLFSCAVELRFDADENSTPANKVSKIETGPQDLKAQNVVAIPEDATIGGEELTVGSWVPLTDYLDYLSTQSTPRISGKGLPSLTYELLNRAWLHAALESYGILDPSGLWARRIAAIRGAYRRIYRIERPYSESARAFASRRVKLQDAETDGYLASPCYFDHAEWITWRGVDAAHAAAGPTSQEIVRNRFAKPPGPNGIIGTPIEDLNEAPANISMVDPALGIFSVDFRPSIAARAANYIHSALITTPSGDPTEEGATWLQDGELYSARQFSTILSVIMEAPNDWQQFYNVYDYGDSEGRGPAYEIRIDPGVALARFDWDDARAAEVKAWFAGDLSASDIGDLKDPINLPELKAVAAKKAREIFARFEDSYEGGLTTGQRDLAMTGSAKEIRHEASPNGILTSVSMPEGRPAIDLSQYMPASVRKLIDRGGEL